MHNQNPYAPPQQENPFQQNFGFQPSTPSGYSLEQVQRPSFQQTPMQGNALQGSQDIIMTKNMEIISSKLDALQASLESLSQRLANIERLAQLEQVKQVNKRYEY